ncbi:MAG TPA: S8 family serine peptidase, partial [Gaiellaceae bacterium]|nr:S8 family serine peptidase [Gaiellaceae bacterium]
MKVLLGVMVAALLVGIGTQAAGSQEPPERKEIKLRFATFDPLLDGPPDIPDPLVAPAASDVYLVQFAAQPLDEQKDRIRGLGARIFFYVPDHAYVVRMDDETREAVENLPFVRWVGPYHPAYKLEETLVKRLTEPPVTGEDSMPRYSIMVLERGGETQGIVAEAIKRLGGTVEATTEQGFRLEASLDDGQLLEVVRMGEILFVDLWAAPEDDMDIVRQISGADFIEAAGGYTGQGVRGEVMDNRLRTTHQDFQATPPIIHAGNNMPTESCSGNGHGTCAYGVVFGDGAGNTQARGLLPDGQGIYADRSFVADRYAHTAELVDPTDDFRAVFQSNSWGGGLTTAYTTVSAEMDDILFLNDIVVTQSQSNNGNQSSRPQAWAKNIVSVGGIIHQNTLDRSDDAWGGGASIGPAADGRIKPDLSHFYDATFTTSSTGDANYTNFGGTSGATPITAGHFGLLFQMWADGVFAGAPGAGGDVFDSRPHMTTAKALMVNTAFQYPFVGAGDDPTRIHQGWGMADLQNSYELARQHGWQLPLLVDETAVLGPGDTDSYPLDVGADDCFLRATMTYADPMGNPAATEARVNDLSLRLLSPGGTTYWGNNGLITGTASTSGGASNTVDTVENVILPTAELGTWTIEVLGDEIVEDGHPETGATDADYALVVTKCAELDAEVLSMTVIDPPAEILVDQNVPVTVEAAVRNNGPGGPSPAAFEVTFDAVAPADCTIVGPSQVVVPVSLDVGESADVQAPFTIRCSEPSFHTFEFTATIAPADPDVRDTDPTNDEGTADLTVGVVKQVLKNVTAIGFDVPHLRAVIAPVEPGEPMVGIGPLAAPWAAAGDRPLPWARTANPLPAIAECPDALGHVPQPGHGNWTNPREPITLVVPDPGVPVTIAVDDLDCSSDAVNVDKTVRLTVVSGGCSFGGAATTSQLRVESEQPGWNLQSTPVVFPGALTLSDTGCTMRVDVVKEPSDIHFELVGQPTGSIEVVLVAAKDGRMTGGGSVRGDGGVRYTHGFQARCDGSPPENLQINWSQGSRFHLESVTGVVCFDDPTIGEGNPVAGFDT